MGQSSRCTKTEYDVVRRERDAANKLVRVVQAENAYICDALKKLQEAVVVYVADLDNLMKNPSTYERGRQQALLVGSLLNSLEGPHVAQPKAKRKVKV